MRSQQGSPRTHETTGRRGVVKNGRRARLEPEGEVQHPLQPADGCPHLRRDTNEDGRMFGVESGAHASTLPLSKELVPRIEDHIAGLVVVDGSPPDESAPQAEGEQSLRELLILPT